MARCYRLLPVAVAVAISVLVLPQLLVLPVLLALMFVAGCLLPDRPVAVASAMAAVFLLPCAVVLAVIGASWFPGGWQVFYPLRFGYPLRFTASPAMLLAVGDLVVQVIYAWGWAVVAAYMGAGTALRLRNRAVAA